MPSLSGPMVSCSEASPPDTRSEPASAACRLVLLAYCPSGARGTHRQSKQAGSTYCLSLTWILGVRQPRAHACLPACSN